MEKLFATRAEAENALELMAQQHGIDGSNIFITADGPDNSVGTQISGGDAPTSLEEARANGAVQAPVRL